MFFHRTRGEVFFFASFHFLIETFCLHDEGLGDLCQRVALTSADGIVTGSRVNGPRG